MKKKNSQNRMYFKMTDIALVLITIIMVIATGCEILNYVQLEQGLDGPWNRGYSDTVSDEEMLALEKPQDQLFVVQRSEYHNSIVTLLCATLLSFALDAAYFSLRDKKA